MGDALGFQVGIGALAQPIELGLRAVVAQADDARIDLAVEHVRSPAGNEHVPHL